ncbi:MAG: patatin-like phospholipase family protein [Candidatus Marinimicrobia bacterium]|nr:patatin-like phospholipase family protein [Candidatus Neomarinimicrobiota bacterium]MBT3691675.1 patatin-like phospholipase family protein [Candidatus Neomarinimicrobiota bacterium]MBT3732458.1 patatin-like phospholipase family protein [Candidatus Neomarinimicrobiota bacterium]MBT4143909.1 patatin-like phospholipase family protein [Candidatus Neomarinimicrobiota bacterium]MBT4176975.1 patatin-like phospholipase family protein [Candidatus Neomarinimicrobiota bacterium]
MNSTSNLHHKKVALVLSGGGAQGLAHIGVLKAFEENNTPIDLIVGTSAGALVGGLYASGISVDQLEKMAKDGTIMKLFLGRNDMSDIPVWQRSEKSSGKFSIRKSDERISGPPGLLNDQLIWRDLFLLTAPANHLAQSNFDSLFIPFRAIGANIIKQKTVVFGSGSLTEAMRVSMSIPMVYPAVVKNDAILIDGGIYNNMPTDIAQNLGADYIIAVNVDDTPPPIEKMKDIFDYFDLFSSVLFSPTDSVNVSGWNYFINVDTDGFNIFDFSAGEALIERGYDSGSKAAKNIRKIINRQQDSNKIEERRFKYQNALIEKSIKQIQWIDHASGKVIGDEYEIFTPFNYSAYKIHSIVNSLYATNIYNLIIPELSMNGNILKLRVRKKATIQMIPEIKINSVNGFNLSGDWDYHFADNQYSLRSKVGVGNYNSDAEITFSPNKFILPYTKHRSRMIWKLGVFGNYQTYNDFNNSQNIYHFASGFGLSVHRLLSWNQQFIASINFHANRWVNIEDTLFPDNSEALYPVFNLRYENNHIHKVSPNPEGWKLDANIISGRYESNYFTGIQGQATIGVPFKNKYHFGMDVSYQTMSDPAPLELFYPVNLPTAFTQTLFVDTFSYSSLNVSYYITRTFFRDDVFLSVNFFNTYLENRILDVNDGWISGMDVSIKYESILGPIELGWSIFDRNDYQIVSWTKLHIYL